MWQESHDASIMGPTEAGRGNCSVGEKCLFRSWGVTRGFGMCGGLGACCCVAGPLLVIWVILGCSGLCLRLWLGWGSAFLYLPGALSAAEGKGGGGARLLWPPAVSPTWNIQRFYSSSYHCTIANVNACILDVVFLHCQCQRCCKVCRYCCSCYCRCSCCSFVCSPFPLFPKPQQEYWLFSNQIFSYYRLVQSICGSIFVSRDKYRIKQQKSPWSSFSITVN